VRRWLLLPLLVIALAFLYYKLGLGQTSRSGELVSSRPVATIGSGEDSVGVAADGTILSWLTLSEGVELPALPLSTPPEKAQLDGTLLEQTRVLGAAPPALRPYVASSYYGESGVDVELRSGIELRFGDASRAEKKWRAAAAVLADPSVSALDYVDLHAPSHPAIGGSGHALPPLP
jgi:Cell division protein FtsQ/DivIB, C-terminal